MTGYIVATSVLVFLWQALINNLLYSVKLTSVWKLAIHVAASYHGMRINSDPSRRFGWVGAIFTNVNNDQEYIFNFKGGYQFFFVPMDN